MTGNETELSDNDEQQQTTDHRTETETEEEKDDTQLTAAAVSSEYKVRGKAAISTGAGVVGHNTASTGGAIGVEGVTDSTDAGAIGVRAQLADSSSQGYALEAISESNDTRSAAIRADAQNGGKGLSVVNADANGVEVETTGYTGVYSTTDGQFYNALRGDNTSTSGKAWGVRGDTASGNVDAYGVRGNANNTSGQSKGVGGFTYGTGDDAAGVYGEAFGSSGVAYGVNGVTQSTDGEAAGVFGQTSRSGSYGLLGSNTGGGYALGTKGDAEIDGSLDVTKVGASVFLSKNQTVPDDTDTRVVFDLTEAEHFNNYDPSTGVYTVPVDGDYHVDFLIGWYNNFSAGDTVIYELLTDGTNTGGIRAYTDITGDSSPQRSFSKTLFGLSAGETIEVQVKQRSGSSMDIYGNQSGHTYMTVHKVG